MSTPGGSAEAPQPAIVTGDALAAPAAGQRAESAQAHRDQASTDYENAKAAAAATKEHGQALIAHAKDQLAKAKADHDRELANADRIAAGEEPAGPAEGEEQA